MASAHQPEEHREEGERLGTGLVAAAEVIADELELDAILVIGEKRLEDGLTVGGLGYGGPNDDRDVLNMLIKALDGVAAMYDLRIDVRVRTDNGRPASAPGSRLRTKRRRPA